MHCLSALSNYLSNSCLIWPMPRLLNQGLLSNLRLRRRCLLLGQPDFFQNIISRLLKNIEVQSKAKMKHWGILSSWGKCQFLTLPLKTNKGNNKRCVIGGDLYGVKFGIYWTLKLNRSVIDTFIRKNDLLENETYRTFTNLAWPRLRGRCRRVV